ncbi:MAG: nucleoside-triphosphatase [Planctomycetota bacterium]
MSLFLLIGDRHAGKTSACRTLAAAARARGLTIGGVLAPAVHEGDQCLGYDVVDLATGATTRLADHRGPGVEHAGRFHFLAGGLRLGRAALARAIADAPHLVIVDEVGPLELAGGGWAAALDALAALPGGTVFAVRPDLAAEVAARWGVPPERRLDLRDGVDTGVARILAPLGPRQLESPEAGTCQPNPPRE